MAPLSARGRRQRFQARRDARQIVAGAKVAGRESGAGLARRAQLRISESRKPRLDRLRSARLKSCAFPVSSNPKSSLSAMKINGNEIRPGNVIQHKGALWVAVKT